MKQPVARAWVSILVEQTLTHDTRECRMIYRGPGFFADARFGSSPTPSSTSPVRKLDRGQTGRLKKRDSLLTGGGGGERRAELYHRKKPQSFTNHSILSARHRGTFITLSSTVRSLGLKGRVCLSGLYPHVAIVFRGCQSGKFRSSGQCNPLVYRDWFKICMVLRHE